MNKQRVYKRLLGYLTLVTSCFVLGNQGPLQAAETCPIFNEISRQMEAAPTLTAWELSGAPTGIISTDDPNGLVNIRDGAGVDFALVATAQPAEAVTMTAHALGADCKNWFRVAFEDDRIGWVHEQYVKGDRGSSMF